MKKYLRQRVDRLDAKGIATFSHVLIELDLCSTPADYERAFHKAWKQVPAGAAVYCWMRQLSDPEFTAMVEGRLVPPHVTGIYLKLRASNHLFDTTSKHRTGTAREDIRSPFSNQRRIA